MARSASAIQAEITVIETELQSSASLISSAATDSTSITRRRELLEKRLDQLYIQLDRTNGTAPMIVRGVVKGLR
jgi:hypothetical protein